MDNQSENHNEDEEWYKINKCSSESNLFILCMKKPIELENLKDNKCKHLFDKWFKCINLKIKIL